MLINLPPMKRSVRRRKKKGAALPPPPPPVEALVLTAATFEPWEMWTELTFDRAINIAAIDASALIVDDGAYTGELWTGDAGGVSLIAPNILRMYLVSIGPATAPAGVLLSASDATGIVATNDGGTWAGVSELDLPFGS